MSREDLSNLLGALIPFAQQVLSERGSFPPFAGTMDTQGQVRGFAAKPEAECLPPAELVELLLESLREAAQRGECRAGAICCDVLVAKEAEGEKVSAIAISLEAADGTSMECFMPYKKNEAGAYEYEEIFGGLVPPRIFVPAT